MKSQLNPYLIPIKSHEITIKSHEIQIKSQLNIIKSHKIPWNPN